MAISAEFTADFSQYTAAAGEATAALVELQQTSTAIDVSAQAQAAGTALRSLGTEVVGFASEFVASFAEEEAATKRLEQALRNTGHASTEVIEAYGEMGAKFQETTIYADDAITAAQTVFTQIGHVGPEQMQPAIQAAADLAAGLGIGIEEAAAMMSKALGSGGESLGQLKKVLGDNIEKGAGFEQIMGAVNAQFGGQAAAAMETTEGKLTALGNQWDDLKGRIGELLASAVTPLLDAFMSLDPTLQTVIVGAGGLVLALTPIALAIGSVVTAITPLIGVIGGAGGLTALLAGLGTTLAALAAPVAIAVAAIGAVYLAFKHWDAIEATCRAVYEGIKRWLVDGFKALLAPITATVEGVAGGFKWLYDKVVGRSYVPDLINGISDEFARLHEVMVVPAVQAASETEAAFAGAMSAIGEMAGGALAGPGKRPGGGGGGNLPTVNPFSGEGLVGTDPRVLGWLSQGYSLGEAVALAQGHGSRFTAPKGRDPALRAMGMAPVTNITVQGSVLSTEDQLAKSIEEAMMKSYRRGGNLLPV